MVLITSAVNLTGIYIEEVRSIKAFIVTGAMYSITLVMLFISFVGSAMSIYDMPTFIPAIFVLNEVLFASFAGIMLHAILTTKRPLHISAPSHSMGRGAAGSDGRIYDILRETGSEPTVKDRAAAAIKIEYRYDFRHMRILLHRLIYLYWSNFRIIRYATLSMVTKLVIASIIVIRPLQGLK